MVDSVHPTQEDASSHITSGAIKWAASTDWVVPSGDDYLAAFDGLSGTPLNGFEESHAADSFDVTIDTGEAFVGGRWMARDVTTTVTLASGTNNQTVYAGWESSAANSVVIGLDSAFSSTDDGRRTPIWEFDADGSGTTSSTKLHDNEPIHPHAADADQLDNVDPSNYARKDLTETITPNWVFDSGLQTNGNVDIDGRIDVRDDSSQLRVHETDTDAQWNVAISSGNLNLVESGGDGLLQVEQGGGIRIDSAASHIELDESDTGTTWRVEAQADDFRIVEPGVEEWLRIDADQGNRVEHPGGIAAKTARLPPQSSEPASPQNGELAVQDGVNWDPVATGNQDLVVYLGGAWELAT